MNQQEIMDLLSRKDSIYTLIQIYENPGARKYEIATSDEGAGQNAKIRRIEDFRKAGLVTIDESPRKHGTKFVTLTPKGQWVATTLHGMIL